MLNSGRRSDGPVAVAPEMLRKPHSTASFA